MTRLFRKLLIKLFAAWRRLRRGFSVTYKWRFLLDTIGNNGHAFLAPSCRFFVPTRNGGAGTVIIGERTKLGFPPSIRYGAGDILLQPRTPEAVIRVGADCFFNNNLSIISRRSITIGNQVLIGACVNILDSDFHNLSPETRRQGQGETMPVVIEDNVWIGSNVTILKGVSVGTGSVIAPGAIVTKNIPGNVLAGGVPAKVIKAICA